METSQETTSTFVVSNVQRFVDDVLGSLVESRVGSNQVNIGIDELLAGRVISEGSLNSGEVLGVGDTVDGGFTEVVVKSVSDSGQVITGGRGDSSSVSAGSDQSGTVDIVVHSDSRILVVAVDGVSGGGNIELSQETRDKSIDSRVFSELRAAAAGGRGLLGNGREDQSIGAESKAEDCNSKNSFHLNK